MVKSIELTYDNEKFEELKNLKVSKNWKSWEDFVFSVIKNYYKKCKGVQEHDRRMENSGRGRSYRSNARR